MKPIQLNGIGIIPIYLHKDATKPIRLNAVDTKSI